MPPKVKVTKDDIIRAAVDVIRDNGAAALNARAVASKLGTSTQPIFSNYESMDTLKADVIASANDIYHHYLECDMSSGKYPVYKASGIAYIRFAKEERELFKLLFMRDRSNERIADNVEEMKPLLQIIQKNTGLGEQDAFIFHIEMWVYVHGIATMIATSYLELDWETVDRILTDAYLGLKERYCRRGLNNGSD